MLIDDRLKAALLLVASWLGEGLRPNYLVSFGLILAAVVEAFR